MGLQKAIHVVLILIFISKFMAPTDNGRFLDHKCGETMELPCLNSFVLSVYIILLPTTIE